MDENSRKIVIGGIDIPFFRRDEFAVNAIKVAK